MINSLKIKILGLITLIVVLIVSVSAFVNFGLQEQMITNLAKRDSKILVEAVNNSISSAMRQGQSVEVGGILAKIRSAEGINHIRIFDESGKILNSSDSGEIGKNVSPVKLGNFHSGDSYTIRDDLDNKSFETVIPILNRAECHRCHPASKEILGILEIDQSLKHLQTFISRGKQNAIASTAIIVLLIFITISAFLIIYVDRPIKKLIACMHSIEEGRFEANPAITSSNEMKLLSENFNTMTGRLENLLCTTVNHERELAKAQEQLAHHQEIHNVNLKLEEKLIEIENLNIALEERIEEIEEANYKIADLAGDLEDKNTNLEKAVSRLSTLYKVGLAINSTMDFDKIFELIVRTTMENMNAQIGYILLHNNGEETFTVTTLIGHENTAAAGTILPLKTTSVSGWVIDNKEPLLIPDINQTPQFARYSALGYERKTLICAPLMIKDKIIGTITVVNKNDNSIYTADELELLSTIATQASVAINNARLYEEQQQTYINTIHALVSAIEASDSYTRGHSERVTRYSVELAKKLNLPMARLNIVERAAILHDIGKIGINVSLLHKQGKLTPEDVHELRQHPVIGMRILEPIEFLHDVKLCIGQHHERYDGQGYPNNVPKEKLILESRILAIADAYDAMTSDRPYRMALPKEVAIKELLDNSGAQFDPELVPHFIELLENGSLSAPAAHSLQTKVKQITNHDIIDLKTARFRPMPAQEQFVL